MRCSSSCVYNASRRTSTMLARVAAPPGSRSPARHCHRPQDCGPSLGDTRGGVSVWQAQGYGALFCRWYQPFQNQSGSADVSLLGHFHDLPGDGVGTFLHGRQCDEGYAVSAARRPPACVTRLTRLPARPQIPGLLCIANSWYFRGVYSARSVYFVTFTKQYRRPISAQARCAESRAGSDASARLRIAHSARSGAFCSSPIASIAARRSRVRCPRLRSATLIGCSPLGGRPRLATLAQSSLIGPALIA